MFTIAIKITGWWRMGIHMRLTDYYQEDWPDAFDDAFWQQMFEWYTMD